MLENSIEPIFVNSTSMGDVSGLINSTSEDIEIKLLYKGNARDMFSGNLRINNPLLIQGSFGRLTCYGGEVSSEGANLRNNDSYHNILYKPKYIIDGSYKSEEPRFNKIIVEIQDLSEWLQERRYSYAYTEDEEILSIGKENAIVDKHILDKLTIKIVNNLERKHTKTDLT